MVRTHHFQSTLASAGKPLVRVVQKAYLQICSWVLFLPDIIRLPPAAKGSLCAFTTVHLVSLLVAENVAGPSETAPAVVGGPHLTVSWKAPGSSTWQQFDDVTARAILAACASGKATFELEETLQRSPRPKRKTLGDPTDDIFRHTR